jgi:hypothetical protein
MGHSAHGLPRVNSPLHFSIEHAPMINNQHVLVQDNSGHPRHVLAG